MSIPSITRAVVILLVIALTGMVTGTTVQAKPDFDCSFNGEITLRNPDPGNLIWVNASSNDVNCRASFLVDSPQTAADRASIRISGCSMQSNISVILSTLINAIPDLVTEESVVFYTIRCLPTPNEGFTRDFVDKSLIRLVTHKMGSVTPKLLLESLVYKSTGTPEETGSPGTVTESLLPTLSTLPTTTTAPSAKLFEELIWVVQGPEGYRIKPLNCSIYSGVLADGSRHEMALIKDGCSLNKEMVSDFRLANASEPHRAVASFRTFRFDGSQEINLACRIKGCVLRSSSCNWTCARKKRRSFEEIIGMNEKKSASIVNFRDSGRKIRDVKIGVPDVTIEKRDVTIRKRDVGNAVQTSDSGYEGYIRVTIYVYDDVDGIKYLPRSTTPPKTWFLSTLLTLTFSLFDCLL